MRIHGFRIIIKHHVFIRAMQRKIHPDLIEDTLKTGEMRRFGKNNVKFIKKFKNFTVVCVDEIIGDEIKILTIERR